MRLLYLTQTGPETFAPLFDSTESFYTVLEKNEDSISKDDVILYGGGTDVDPDIYGESRHFQTQSPDVLRDRIEKLIFRRYKDVVRGFIGVCRGSQYLTVLNGGKLIQHIGWNHCHSHLIVDVKSGERVWATSTHHQMMFPFNLPKKDYEIIAVPHPERIASRYCRDNLTDYSVKDVPQEPEIVWYPKTKSLCIQGHPEYQELDSPFSRYARDLVTERILNA